MPFTVSNQATAADAGLVAVLGFKAYFKEDGQTDFHDFGHVRSPNREQDLTELEIKSARLGKLATIKKITTESSLEFTFDSASVLDQKTVELHSGGEAGTGDIGTNAHYAVEDFVGTKGSLLLVQENAESSEQERVAYYPSVQIKGDGEESGDGENEATLTFRVTVTPDEAYTIPGALAAATPAAPYGFRYVVNPGDLQAVLDAIADDTAAA